MENSISAGDQMKGKAGSQSSSEEALVEFSTAQLDRVLGFFPRVDAKITSLFAVVIGLLGVLALNVQKADGDIWYLVLLYILTLLCACGALWFLYKASFPDLNGGEGSRIYFAEIAKTTEAKYAQSMKSLSLEEMNSELVGQIWRNSKILNDKFVAVRHAFYWTAAMLPLWMTAITIAAVTHSAILVR